jgi:hypothetical protein
MVRPPMLPWKAAQAMVIAVAMIAVTGSGPAFAGAAHAQRAPAETAQKSAQASAERTGPLLNGDRISIVAGPSGQPTVAILGTAPGAGGPLLHFSVGEGSYEVPFDALPYLGRGLDPSLFDVAGLAAHFAAARCRSP